MIIVTARLTAKYSLKNSDIQLKKKNNKFSLYARLCIEWEFGVA